MSFLKSSLFLPLCSLRGSLRVVAKKSCLRQQIPYRFSECNWHLPRGETCEVGPSKNCAVEDTIKYIGDERNCQIQIERVQQDEDGNWQVYYIQNYHSYFIILFAPVIYFSETFHSNSAI